MEYDVVIIGAGIYGMYISQLTELKNKRKLIIEMDDEPFQRASYINQARIHNGYHYPRSLETATDTHSFFNKFNKEFKYAINSKFKNIYAISKYGSKVNATEFEEMCKKVKIPLKKEKKEKYFKEDSIEAAYSTLEYVFDSNKIKAKLYKKSKNNNTTYMFNTWINNVYKEKDKYVLRLNNNQIISTGVVINTTYASINIINELFGFPALNIKYELCELCLGMPNKKLNNFSFTIMDGNFFSLMPFYKNLYSLTNVHYTPHFTSYDKFPKFDCQKHCNNCSENFLENCNFCKYKPISKIDDMLNQVNNYLLDKYKFNYVKSLFAIKPILQNAEYDDKRPTIINKYREKPTFITCLSGKVSTIYLLKNFIIEDMKNWK